MRVRRILVYLVAIIMMKHKMRDDNPQKERFAQRTTGLRMLAAMNSKEVRSHILYKYICLYLLFFMVLQF